MVSLNIDLPDWIVKELEERAGRFQRPIKEEAEATILNAILSKPWRVPRSLEERLTRAKAIRDASPNAWITEEFLRAAIDEGRP